MIPISVTGETPTERKRRLARERKRRERERKRLGDKLLLVPGKIADEIGEDEEFRARALEILRSATERDIA